MKSCRNCEDRHIGCHGTCKDYKEWLKDHREKKKKAQRNERKYRDYFYE